MTLDEAIRHCEEVADRLRSGCDEVATGCEADHRQLADWLKELKERRSSAQAHENDHIADVSKKDTISRAAAIEIVRVRCARIPTMAIRAMQELKDLPTEEPEPKRGRWVKMSDSFGTYYACSCCGEDCTPHGMKTPFCPSCGAQMERGGEQT